MLTKVERFVKWRGKKALEEQSHIDAALLVSHYMHSVNHLDTIKADFSSDQSVRYKALNKYGKCGVGILLHSNLEIEEMLEQLPASGVIERQVLNQLKNSLNTIYTDVRSNTSEKIDKLIANTKKLLELNAELFVDKKQAKKMFFNLYIFLNMGNLALKNLNMFQTLAASAYINLEQLKKDITSLLHQTEKRVVQVDKLLSNEEKAQNLVPAKKTIQDYFNEPFSVLLKTEGYDQQKLILLEENLGTLTKDLNHLILIRKQKAALQLDIQMIQRLLNASEENDKKILTRSFFLELVGSNIKSFNILMSNSDSFKKEQLIKKIAQLKTPGLYQNFSYKVIYGKKWVTSLIAVAYEYVVPPIKQNVSANIPTNLDSECHNLLNDFAQEHLLTLKQKLVDTDKGIDRLTHHLSNGVNELNQLITNESTENLTLLVKANNAAKDALSEYRRIAKSLENTFFYLNLIKESNSALTAFIQNHDGFLVRLSNLFANISSIFKSETAAMIDSAREMNERLGGFELVYKRALTEGLNTMNTNSDINMAIKVRLQQNINIELTKEIEIESDGSPSKEDVRYLMYNLKKVFNMKSSTGLLEQKTQTQVESLLPSLSLSAMKLV